MQHKHAAVKQVQEIGNTCIGFRIDAQTAVGDKNNIASAGNAH